MAERLNFTNRAIEDIAPPVERDRLEFKDTKVAGLYLRVTRAGIKSFSFVGRAKGSGRTERATLGRYPNVKAEEARNKARKIAGLIASGANTVAGADRARRGELTLVELWAEYRKHLLADAKNGDAGAEGTWRLHIEPTFGRLKLSAVTSPALSRWHKALPTLIVERHKEDRAARERKRHAELAARADSRALRRRGPDPKPRPEAAPRTITGERAANQALNLMRAMYAWAKSREVKLFDGENPAAGLKRFKERPRKRFLRSDELQSFFGALAEESNGTMRDFFLVALLTGARRSNVAAMKWAAVSLDRAEWALDDSETKNDEPQTVALVPEVVAILRARLAARNLAPKTERAKLEAQFVFPSGKSEPGHIVEPKGAWKRVLQRAKIDDLRIHDLRRTLGSWQARTGASLVLIGKSLNHLSQEATAIYAHLDLDPVRQSVTRATSAMFEAAGIKPAAEVVALPTKKAPKRGGKRSDAA